MIQSDLAVERTYTCYAHRTGVPEECECLYENKGLDEQEYTDVFGTENCTLMVTTNERTGEEVEDIENELYELLRPDYEDLFVVCGGSSHTYIVFPKTTADSEYSKKEMTEYKSFLEEEVLKLVKQFSIDREATNG